VVPKLSDVSPRQVCVLVSCTLDREEIMSKMTELQAEIIKEEINQLLFIAERHARWYREITIYEDRKPHRIVADEIKSIVNEINNLFFGTQFPSDE
jgi:hypothetical protein